MNATRVSISAGRRPGMAITFILLALTASRQGKAADVNITITGVLTGGWDQLGIFATGKEAESMGAKFQPVWGGASVRCKSRPFDRHRIVYVRRR
jgi:hypothetical protein